MGILSSDKDKKLLKALKDERDLAIKWRDNCGWDQMSSDSVNYYQYGVAEDLNDVTLKKRKQRKANYVFSNIESIIPKIFDKFPGFQVIGRGVDDIEKAPRVEQILRYKMEQLKSEAKMEDGVRDQLVKSYGLFKVTWETQLKKGKDKEVEGVDKDDVCLDVIQPDNFYITAGDTRLQEAKGCFEKIFSSPEEVKTKYGKDVKADATLLDDSTKTDKEKGEKVIVWQYTGEMNGKKKMWFFTDKEILQEDSMYEHGQKPYIVLPNYRRSDEFYPWSEVFQIMPLQKELVEIDNQASEFRKRAINPKKVVQEGAVDKINQNRLKDPRVNLVIATDINGIKWESPGLIGQDIYNFRLIKKEDIGLMTGQNELSRGGTERVVKTATGQQILFDAAQGRVRQKVRQLERAIKQILFQVQGLLAEFQDKEEQIKITDTNDENPFSAYTKEDIQGKFDFIIDIVESTPILREKRAQLALDLYTLFKDDQDVDQRELKEKVLKVGFMDIQAGELLKPDEQGLPIEEQQEAVDLGFSAPQQQIIPQGIIPQQPAL